MQDLGLSKSTCEVADIVEQYSPWVISVARHVYIHFNVDGAEFQDYVQYGTLGMLEALSRFDLELGSGFSSFAYMRVKGAILNNIHRFNEYSAHNRYRKKVLLERTQSIEPPTTGDNDNYETLAEIIVELAIGFSLEDIVNENEESKYPNPYEALTENQLSQLVKDLLEQLPMMEAKVLRLHYFHQLAFTDIADIYQLSRGRITQLHKKGLASLADSIKEQPALIC